MGRESRSAFLAALALIVAIISLSSQRKLRITILLYLTRKRAF
jgi:hypothetical protein